MPDSLLTTKRKFYKFLDQLSAPAPQAPPSSTTTTLNSKKRPLSTTSTTAPPQPFDLEARLAARAAKRIRPSTSSASLASFRSRLDNPPPPLGAALTSNPPPRRSDTSTNTPSLPAKSRHVTEPAGLPAFSPWSHDSFLARLKTFAPVTDWLPKPDERVGEVAWAKRGWSCVVSETVGCASCGKRVPIDFRGPTFNVHGRKRVEEFGSAEVEVPAGGGDEGRQEAGEEENGDERDELEYEEAFERGLVERYAALIEEGHAHNCLWRKTGCKDDIYRLPVVRSAWWQEHVKKAYASGLAVAGEISKVQFRNVEGIELGVGKILRDLPDNFLADDSAQSLSGELEFSSEEAAAAKRSQESIREKALTIAMTGWGASTESSTHLLTCGACFQRIGLWLYQSSTPVVPAQGDETTPGDDEDAASTTMLDLVAQHREHCPWRNATSQAAMGSYASWPAYRILWDVVGRYAAEQRRRSRDRYGITVPTDEGVEAAPAEANAADDVDSTVDGHVEGSELAIDVPVVGVKDWERREETARLDRERTNKLRRLKRVLGFKFRMPAGVGTKGTNTAASANADAAPAA